MMQTADREFEMLHVLRVKGFADSASVERFTGDPSGEVESALLALARQGLVSRKCGRMNGWLLTPAGRARHAELLKCEPYRVGAVETLVEIYERFSVHNAMFKAICNDWQLRPVGADVLVNDHLDRSYDDTVLGRLDTLHSEVLPVGRHLVNALGRLQPHVDALLEAKSRIDGGDRSAIAAPMARSYHDNWMELHQDLILTLGITRTHADR